VPPLGGTTPNSTIVAESIGKRSSGSKPRADPSKELEQAEWHGK
jgi:hypothetical protein